MSNWKKFDDECDRYVHEISGLDIGRQTHINKPGSVFFGHVASDDSYQVRHFPTEQAAREFIEEFLGVSANGKLSDSKSDNQGSSPCAPDKFIGKDVRIKEGAYAGCDMRSWTWPKIANKTYDPDTVFRVTRTVGYRELRLQAPGFGIIGGDYGSGAIHAYPEDLIVVESDHD